MHQQSIFSVDGLIPDENSIKKKIYEELKPWFAAGLPNKTTALSRVFIRQF